MASIQKTQRNISRLEIVVSYDYDDENERAKFTIDAVKIVKKFSATIKYLRLIFAPLTLLDFHQIVSLLPNVEHLDLQFLELKQLKHQGDATNLTDKRLELHRLKKLDIWCCDKNLFHVLDGLPAGVLRECTIYADVGVNSLDRFIEQQYNIKHLNLDLLGDLPSHIFDRLALKSLIYTADRKFSVNCPKILSKQTKLKSLVLHEYRVDNDMLNVITNHMSELETVCISLDSKSLVATFNDLAKLKNLKHLELRKCSLDIVEKLSAIDNTRLITLALTMNDNLIMPFELSTVLAKSMPNLRRLTFGNRGIFLKPTPWIGAVAIMQNFNFLKCLHIAVLDDGMGLDEKIDGCFNANLTELEIEVHCDSSGSSPLLTKLSTIYPNLEKLKTNISCTFFE